MAMHSPLNVIAWYSDTYNCIGLKVVSLISFLFISSVQPEKMILNYNRYLWTYFNAWLSTVIIALGKIE